MKLEITVLNQCKIKNAPLSSVRDNRFSCVMFCCYSNRGTVEDTELIDGLVFNQRSATDGGPSRVEKAKIGLIQFCISPPKTDVSNRWM